MGSLPKNIQSMHVFLKISLLVLHISYYASITFLMMLSVIFLSMLIMLLSTLCDQAFDLWQSPFIFRFFVNSFLVCFYLFNSVFL